MRNHTSVAKVVVAAAYTLAVALLIIGVGVKSSWAGSDPPSGLNFTPVLSDSSSAAARAPAAPHKHFLYAGLVEDCRRGCAGDFARCNTNHPDQTAQCKHDYIQCLAKCTSHNG